MQVLKRSEIENIYKWKVKDLYESDSLWEEDYKKVIENANKPCELKGHIGENAHNLAEVVRIMDEEEYLLERVYVYAFMKYYEDTSDTLYQEMSGKAQMAAVALGEKYAFVTPEIMEIDDEVMNNFLEDDTIKPYRHMLEDMLSQKAYTLSQKEEQLLAMAHQISSSPKEIFSKFNNADVKFKDIEDENGNTVPVTNGKYSVYMESHNRNVRKAAFESLYASYMANSNTLSSMYYANVKQAAFFAKARKYDSTLQMYLSDSFIPVEVYKNLVKTVNDNIDALHDYVSLRKEALQVDELHFYDVYAPMVEDFNRKYSYDEAKQIVIDALCVMGDDYVNIVKEGFNNGWVDVYENEGKRTGAFSWGAYGTHPYVFLNYTDTLNDVFTLIHEMGHAMHTFYSNANQSHMYAGYKIFVAEVASTVNEAILINYMLKNSEDEKERKYLINHYLEQFKGTLFRQTMFAEFEMITHKMCEDGEVLSRENLCDVYRRLNEKYFGKDMVIDEQIAYEWSRIPHFYTPFYVYQYATGFSAAITIASRIIEGDSNVLEGYKKFLSSGSSMHPIELLKLCGVDMSKPDVIVSAIDVFRGLIKDFKK